MISLASPHSQIEDTLPVSAEEIAIDQNVTIDHLPKEWQSLGAGTTRGSPQHHIDQALETELFQSNTSTGAHPTQWMKDIPLSRGLQSGNFLSAAGTNNSKDSISAHPRYHEIDDPSQNTSWLSGTDFDFSSLVLPISTTLLEWGQPEPSDALLHNRELSNGETSSTVATLAQLESLPIRIQKQWFTRVSPYVSTSEIHLGLSDQGEVDEVY